MPEYLIEENPYDFGWYNPRRRRRKSRRNPIMAANPIKMPKAIAAYTQNVTMNQIVAAGGGMWLGAYVPGRFMPAPVTMTDKLIRFGYGMGTAVVAGIAGKAVGGTTVAQAAVLGTLGGVFLDSLKMANLITKRGVSRNPRQLGTSTVVSPAMTREQETVSLITP